MALASVLTGTRFKYYDTLKGGGKVRLPAECRICERRDSPAHLPFHMGGKSPPVNPEELIASLVRQPEVANTLNPHVSTPFAVEVEKEIELTGGESVVSETSNIDSLSFNEDLDP